MEIRSTGDPDAPLIYIDGVRFSSQAGGVEATVERIEVIRADVAVARYGEEASGGVIQVWLKHESPEPING